MPEWLQFPPQVYWWAGSLSLLMFLGTLLVLPVLIARMPADYFMHRRPPAGTWRSEHPAVRYLLLAVRNLIGGLFVLVGISMLVLPGQGILTILIGITLLSFPGKHKLELAIVRRRHVLRAINWIRRRAHRPPLLLPAPGLEDLSRRNDQSHPDAPAPP